MPAKVYGAEELRMRTLSGFILQAHDPIYSHQLVHPAFIGLHSLTIAVFIHVNTLSWLSSRCNQPNADNAIPKPPFL